MKLRLLKPRKGLGLNDPWRPIYDMAFGFVVRAKTEGGARLMASKYGGDELKELANVDPWLDPAFSSC
jgi:hypothetical protein